MNEMLSVLFQKLPTKIIISHHSGENGTTGSSLTGLNLIAASAEITKQLPLFHTFLFIDQSVKELQAFFV